MIVHIDSIDDPRLAAYRALKERDLARDGDRFIAESPLVVKRLLASRFEVESVLIADRHVEEFAPVVPDHIPLYVARAGEINGVIGYRFHSGVIACGKRGKRLTIDDAVPPAKPLLTLVVVPDVNNTENLGGLIRIAAAFGADALILGERSCDPFFRQSIRVSMGTVFSLPIIRSENLIDDLTQLKRRWQVDLFATVLDEDAKPLGSVTRPGKVALLFGNESAGLEPDIVSLCDHRVTIPMQLGTDSLNVMVAAGIVMHHFTSPRPRV